MKNNNPERKRAILSLQIKIKQFDITYAEIARGYVKKDGKPCTDVYIQAVLREYYSASMVRLLYINSIIDKIIESRMKALDTLNPIKTSN